MSKRLVIDINTQRTYEETIPPAEQAEIDALQAALTAARQADETARAAVVYGNDAVDITNLDAVRQYVQASRTFLNEATHTQTSVAAQTERNTRAILAILRRLV